MQIDGSEEMLERFKHRAEKEHEAEQDGTVLSFINFIPYPNGQGWDYSWCVENWGTKWDACDPYLEDGGGQDLLYSFNTAWSPPTPVVAKMIEEYPELSFSLYYEEPGCDFQGELNGENGEIVFDECTKFHPECYECGFRDYPSDECIYDDENMDFLCPQCYVKINELTEWDNEKNE